MNGLYTFGSVMRRLRRFAAMLPAERSLLVRALTCVGAIRLGLWLLPLSVVRAKILRLRGVSRDDSVEGIIWGVRTASRYLPAATCLTQALAAQVLLSGSEHQTRIEIGVVKEEEGFTAHAWLVCDQRIVLGGPDVDRYAPLVAWEGNS